MAGVIIAVCYKMGYTTLQFFLMGATGFDVQVEAAVARRGPRLASLITRETNTKANTELALAA